MWVIRKQEREGLTVIQVIFGKKGSGKTKRILDMANASVKEAKGNVLFIDDDIATRSASSRRFASSTRASTP